MLCPNVAKSQDDPNDRGDQEDDVYGIRRAVLFPVLSTACVVGSYGRRHWDYGQDGYNQEHIRGTS